MGFHFIPSHLILEDSLSSRRHINHILWVVITKEVLQFAQLIIPLLHDIYKRKFHKNQAPIISSDIFKYSPLLYCEMLIDKQCSSRDRYQQCLLTNKQLLFSLDINIQDILQVFNPLLEEILLAKDCIICFYIQTCYFATGLSELSYSV